MTHIRHECLEAHVLDTGDVFGSLEVFACTIFSAFPSVVHEILGHLAEGSSFLAEIDDNTAAALLRLLHSLFHTEDEIRATCANIGAKDIAAVALVVNTQSETNVRVRHLGWVAEDVYSQATNRRHEELDVVSSNQLGIGSTSLLEQCPAKSSLVWRVYQHLH